MDFEIKRISHEETLLIRHKVMWPNKTIAYVRLPNDEQGRHFGLLTKGKLISIISIFSEQNNIQFRKFATLNEFQGKGYGTKLLAYIINLIESENHHKIWCNARINRTRFYKKFGLQETDKQFEKDGIEYIIMEKEFIK